MIEDPREAWRVAHPLPEVLLLVVCGTIADCDDYEGIAAWGKASAIGDRPERRDGTGSSAARRSAQCGAPAVQHLYIWTGRLLPRYLLDMDEILYDVTDLVLQKTLRPTF
jgi:DDE_Tnp_1-associated